MEVEEFLKEAAVMKEIKHPNLVQLLGALRSPSSTTATHLRFRCRLGSFILIGYSWVLPFR